MSGGLWRGPGSTAVTMPVLSTDATRSALEADGATGLSLAVESFGVRHGLELLERVGAGLVLWFRRDSGLVLARRTGVLADVASIEPLLEGTLADIFADLRRAGGAFDVPARLPDGSSWVARFVPLPEGAVAAVWLERRGRSVQARLSDPAASPPLRDLGMPRRLLTIATHLGSLSTAAAPAGTKVLALQRALSREAWRLMGLHGTAVPLDPQRVSIGKKLDACRGLVSHMIPASAEVVWEPGADLPGVAVPAAGVQVVLEELVRNAVAATESSPGRLRVRCGVLTLHQDTGWHDQTLSAGEYAFLEVADNGRGMTDSELSDAVRGHGAGGVAVVRGLAQGWEGAMRMRSAPGRGTIVQVAFPVVAQLEEPGPAPATQPPPSGVWVVMPAGRMRDRVVEGLRLEGFGVTVNDGASGVQDTLEQMSTAMLPSLLLLNLDLATGHGFALARQLRTQMPELPVVVVTDDPVDEVDLPDLEPGRVVPLQYAAYMAVGATRALLG